MLICTGNNAYKCSEIKRQSLDNIRKVQFSIMDCIPPEEVKRIFEDNTFYFYDEIMDVRSIETNNTKLVGACIKYNADSTCNITIKLTKRS